MAQGDLTLQLSENDYQAIQNIMEGLSELEKSAVIERGLKEGTRILVAQGKTNLMMKLSRDPVNVRARKGNLEKSFTTKTKKKRMSGYAGFARPGGNAAHLVDRGTVERWTKKGYYRGSVSKGSPQTGNRFWTMAVEQKGQAALEELCNSIEESVNTIINSGGRV